MNSAIPKTNLNPPLFRELCRDKLRMIHLLGDNGIACPETVPYSRDAMVGFLQRYGEAVLKPRFSQKGEGVMLTDRMPKVDLPSYLIQRRIICRPVNFCIRVFAQDIDGLVTGSYARVSSGFAANLSQGAAAVPADVFLDKNLPGKHRIMIETANRIIEMAKRYAFREIGIDLISDSEQVYVLEINSKPGIEGFFRTGQENLAEIIIRNRVKSCAA